MSPQTEAPEDTAVRYRLRGCLATVSFLHLGSGETVEREGLWVEEKGRLEGEARTPAQVAAVAVDFRGRPYLPGTALKGVLRSWVEQQGVDERLVARLFGSLPAAEDESAVEDTDEAVTANEWGGGATFYDCPLTGEPSVEVTPPFWCSRRKTGVVARVAIDRRFGTASHERLFHQEVVPSGASFAVEVVTQGLELEELALLCLALESFGEDSPTALGAQTADGWGRMTWCPEAPEMLGPAQVRSWLQGGARSPARHAFQELDSKQAKAFRKEREKLEKNLVPTCAAVTLEVHLHFAGPFLVSDTDPERVGKGTEKPDAVPRRDAQGRIVLPASSLRGALRSQAERILRTLGGLGAACAADGPRRSCGAIEETVQVSGLCPACQVFGAPGWRTSLLLQDFRTAKSIRDEDLLHQHFVAIDRFTGGAAREKKFNLRAACAPVLEGWLKLDLARRGDASFPAWGIALLALVLRDLDEGDVVLGAGAAKGYGSATLTVRSLGLPRDWSPVPDALRRVLEPLAGELETLRSWPHGDTTSVGQALAVAVEELEEAARGAHQSWIEEEAAAQAAE